MTWEGGFPFSLAEYTHLLAETAREKRNNMPIVDPPPNITPWPAEQPQWPARRTLKPAKKSAPSVTLPVPAERLSGDTPVTIADVAAAAITALETIISILPPLQAAAAIALFEQRAQEFAQAYEDAAGTPPYGQEG